MSKTILFVGNEPGFARNLEKSLESLRNDWAFSFATNRTEALRALAQAPFDAVLADLQLPDTSGAQLLDEVMRHFPRTIRLLISDLSDLRAVMKCVGTAHQFLRKPCDPVLLRRSLDRALALEIWLPSERVTTLLSEMQRLPSPPALYFQVVKELQSEHTPLERIGELISRDPAMTAKILQLVNSTVFGLPRPVNSPAEAVLILGVETTKSLILLAHGYSYYTRLEESGFSMDELWRHSIMVARFAQCIARAEHSSASAIDEVYTAGLLHDMGKLVLAANLPDQYREVAALAKERNIAAWEAEQEIFGASHAEIGACLLAIWGLPIPIVESLALHHLPTRLVSQGFCALTAVHAANAIEHAQSAHAGTLLIDREYLAGLRLDGRVDEWQVRCWEENLALS